MLTLREYAFHLLLALLLAIALLTAAPRLAAGLSQLLTTPVSKPMRVTL